MKERKNNDNCRGTRLLVILMAICVCLSIGTLALVVYNKSKLEKEFEKALIDNNSANSESKEVKTVIEDYKGEKISSLKKIKLGQENEVVKIGNKELKIRLDTDNIYVNDQKLDVEGGAYVAGYVTDKFAFFTAAARCGNPIIYAMNENGSIVVNNNLQEIEYDEQLNNVNLKDGYIEAKAYKCDSMDGTLVNVVIKYIDNTLIVTEAK